MPRFFYFFIFKLVPSPFSPSNPESDSSPCLPLGLCIRFGKDGEATRSSSRSGGSSSLLISCLSVVPPSMCDPRERRSRAAGANGRRRWHQRSKPGLIPLADFFPKDNSVLSGINRLHQTMPEEISPDSKCPICLDMFENVAYLDRCWHRFCFRCVLEWSKNKAECPLCKQPFHSIVHSMRSADDYKVHSVRPSEMESFANPNGRRFRYRTTLTGEHPANVNSQRSSSSRRTMSSPNCGILFEGLSTQTTRQRDAEMHQMIRRLASRRQASLEGRFMRHIQEQEMISFRKALYRSGTRVRSIEDGGRYRDISAEFFRRNPACLHRLVPWLKRELTVLFGIHGSLINIVQRVIMSNLNKFDLESQAFANELQPFLLQSTEHFLHEFINFARCPFNIEAYDEHANYDCPAPSREEGSASESSVITISPDETETQAPDCNVFRTDIGQAPWDDETPGPSYSNTEQVHISSSTALNTSESSDEEPAGNRTGLQMSQENIEVNGDSCDSSDNCVIVDYVKPLAERTPELVQLSSDSEVSADDGKKEETDKVQPIQFCNFNLTDVSRSASPSSTGSRDGIANKINEYLSNEKRKSKSEKDEIKFRGASSLQSFSSKEACYGYNSSKRRKPESHVQHSDREHHSSKRKRKHRSREKRKKKKDGSRHKHKKNKRKSTREKSTSQSLSPSSESTELRDLSWSRSQNRDYSGTSRIKDMDYYLRDDYSKSKKYALYNPNAVRSYERHRSRNRSRSRFSSRSRSRSSSRSRSRSSSRSRTSRHHDRGRSEKPGGKRKYKTRHLESSQRGSEETSSVRESNALKKSLPKDQTICSKATSVVDRQPRTETQHKKKKKRSRSPSVEIIYEGVCTSKYDKKKPKRIKSTNLTNSSALSSVVITIDSDSDRENVITESKIFNQLPTKRSSLFLRLAQMINGNSHCQLHSPEQDV
ncbi:E3 ubiquitin-protein ligase Topors [Pituophis catenifer annectens]|uniref:E3 ubiquitin-protein ligase Topors n=1 Tax=Pituophis catenifer annectens TaxID=94852 RepID=UPI003992986C